jgi:hypothetical protein
MIKRVWHGKIELKHFASVIDHGVETPTGPQHVFLGIGKMPFLAELRKWTQGYEYARLDLDVEGCPPHSVLGKIDVDVTVVGHPTNPLEDHSRLRIGDKDILAFLKKAAGRRCSFGLTLLRDAPDPAKP